MTQRAAGSRRPAILAALAYALFGAVWIFFSDQVLVELVTEPESIAFWQTMKGWGFVGLSALYVLGLGLRRAKREADAARREQDLLIVTDSLPGPVSRVDRDGRYLFANAAYTEWFGLAPSEVVGRTHVDVLGDEVYARVRPYVLRALDGEVVQYLNSIVTPAGDTRWGLVTLLPDRDPDGEIRGHFTVVLDVTDKEEATRIRTATEIRYSRLIERAPDAILVVRDGKVTLANPAAAALWHAPGPESLAGHDIASLFADSEQDDIEHFLANADEPPPATPGECRIRRLDGTVLEVELAASSFPDDEGVSQHVMIRDNSARKAAEKALNKLNAELDSRVKRRTADLEIARERAESADRLKSMFLASMSHELRTPLNSIIGFTGVLLQELPGALNAEQKKQLGIVQDASSHLLALINDILDLSKIEAGELALDMQSFDLDAEIRLVGNLLQPSAAAKGLDFAVDVAPGLPAASGDRRRVRQVLTNLVGNAVRFTHAGGVRIEARQAEDGAAAISVTDTGIGIASEHLPELFQPFTQIKAESELVPEGTGLGLAIASRLADNMDGRIDVTSEPGRGSTFTFYLPLAQGDS